jgi:heme/copper-type cytochrome/quinol oxidase subunit 3
MARLSSGWWGMWCLIATEAALFAYLLFAYFYLGSQAHGPWVPELPKLTIALPNTILLLASSFVLYWAESGIKKGNQGRLVIGLAITLIMGIVFVGLQGLEWHNKKFSLGDNAYASSYFVTTGFHMTHVVVGLLILACLLLWGALGKFGHERHAAVSIGALYWHFVDIVWLCVFTSFYLLPYLR